MKTRLLIASAILGVSFYAVANISATSAPKDATTAETTATDTASTDLQSSTDGKKSNDKNSSNSSTKKNLFDELIQIKSAYEEASNKIQQENQAKSTALNKSSVEAEKKGLELAQREAELATLERLLEQNRRSLMNSLDSYNHDSNSLFVEVQEQLQQQQNLLSQIRAFQQEVNYLRDTIDTNLAELSVVNRKQDALILKTKESIRDVVERKLNSPIRIRTEKAVQCSLDETLKTCMARPSTKRAIVDPALYSQFSSEDDEQLFANLDYTFLDFKYINAYQRIDGQTYFNVDANVLIKSNSKMFSNLYRMIGLPETGIYRVTLLSNRDATFYLNGKNVGHGKEITVDVERGHYLVKAIYSGRAESTQENISESTSLYYSF